MNSTPNTTGQHASADALNVLRQILREVLPGHRPHSTDSYLPAQLVEAAEACVAAASADPDPIRIHGAHGWNSTTGRRFDIARRRAGGWHLILLQDGEEEGGAIFAPGEHADALLLGATWVAEGAAIPGEQSTPHASGTFTARPGHLTDSWSVYTPAGRYMCTTVSSDAAHRIARALNAQEQQSSPDSDRGDRLDADGAPSTAACEPQGTGQLASELPAAPKAQPEATPFIAETDLTRRLRQLSTAVAEQDWTEFTMRVPAGSGRDANLVLQSAADEIVRLRRSVFEAQPQASAGGAA